MKTCRWIITPLGRLTPYTECGAPATHLDSGSGSFYCRQHAEDFEGIFGEESLQELPIEEAKP